jgi:hypothetical protein
MKTANLLIILLLFITFDSCEQKEEYTFMGEGVITGYDPRDCACCGGLLINLNSSSTELITDSTYQINLIPKNFDINVYSTFPVFIRLDYERNNKMCGKTIDIIRFERQ